MKESLIKFKNKFKNIFSFKNVNPHLHWDVLLYIFFTIVIILIVFSLYLLYEIKNQQAFQITSPSVKAQNLVNEKLLNDINRSFDIKLIKEKEIKDNINPYKDPSIN